jgi:hypothetical protein
VCDACRDYWDSLPVKAADSANAIEDAKATLATGAAVRDILKRLGELEAEVERLRNRPVPYRDLAPMTPVPFWNPPVPYSPLTPPLAVAQRNLLRNAQLLTARPPQGGLSVGSAVRGATLLRPGLPAAQPAGLGQSRLRHRLLCGEVAGLGVALPNGSMKRGLGAPHKPQSVYLVNLERAVTPGTNAGHRNLARLS